MNLKKNMDSNIQFKDPTGLAPEKEKGGGGKLKVKNYFCFEEHFFQIFS